MQRDSWPSLLGCTVRFLCFRYNSRRRLQNIYPPTGPICSPTNGPQVRQFYFFFLEMCSRNSSGVWQTNFSVTSTRLMKEALLGWSRVSCNCETIECEVHLLMSDPVPRLFEGTNTRLPSAICMIFRNEILCCIQRYVKEICLALTLKYQIRHE